MKKIYQLHYKGKDRAYHNFKSEDEALQHQEHLINLCRSKVSNNEPRAREYLKEARALEVAAIEIKDRSRLFSVVEVTPVGQSIVKSYTERETALTVCQKRNEDTTRFYSIMESTVNGAS